MVRLVPMTDAEFETYTARLIPDYAQEHVEAGNWSPEEALERSERQVRELLPEGPRTPNQFVYTIQDERTETTVGILWFARQQRRAAWEAYVYDIEIDEEYRRRGYGSDAFRALEEKVRGLGLSTISLHVFGHNRAARAMYEGLGYVETDIWMSKTLDCGGA